MPAGFGCVPEIGDTFLHLPALAGCVRFSFGGALGLGDWAERCGWALLFLVTPFAVALVVCAHRKLSEEVAMSLVVSELLPSGPGSLGRLGRDPALPLGDVEFAGSRPSLPKIEVAACRQVDEPLESLSMSELLSRRASPGWLLSGMLRQREAAVILGPSRCLKTSLAVDLCAALASGGEFLGEFAAEQAFRVGFVGGEAAQVAVTSLAERRGDLAALEQIVWAFNLVEPGGAVNGHRLSDWIARNQLEVVLIDAADLTPMTRRAEAAQLRAIADCCLAVGATPIICCRTRKELKPRAMDAADLADAPCGAIARQWLLVNRRDAFEPGSGRHRLWLNFGASSGRSGQWGVDIKEDAEVDSAAAQWEATIRDVASVELEAAEVEAQTLADRLWWRLRCVIQQIDPANATKLKIRELSGMSGGKFGVTWDRMVADGEIVLANGGTSKEPHYRLIDLAEKIARGPVHSPAVEEMEDAAESSPPEKKSQSSPLVAEKSYESSPPAESSGGWVSYTTAELLALSNSDQKKTAPSPVQSARNGPRRRGKRKKRKR